MATKSFDEVLKQARALSSHDQKRLVEELVHTDAPQNGSQHRTLYDALNARGLIGCLTDAPADLSTNPKYMEGFGQDVQKAGSSIEKSGSKAGN